MVFCEVGKNTRLRDDIDLSAFFLHDICVTFKRVEIQGVHNKSKLY